MKIERVSYRALPAHIPPIAAAFAEGDARVVARFSFHPRDERALMERARRAAARRIEPEVAERLRPGPSRDKLLRGAAAVVAGQQPSVGMGPAYNFYKAVSAVRWARRLESLGVPAVAVFWNHSEDDGYPEFDRFTIPDRDGGILTVRVRSAGDGMLSNREAALDPEDARRAFPDTPHRDEVLRVLGDHRPGPVSSTFTALLESLFGEELLVLEPSQLSGSHARAVFERALRNPGTVGRAVEAGGVALATLGFEAVLPVPNGPNVYLVEGGRRLRIVEDAGAWTAGGRRWTTEELLQQRLSAGAALRGVLQDAVLPVALYVGGPHEVGYLSQLSELYRSFELEPPAVAPRISATIVEPRVARAARALGLGASELFLGEEELLRRCVPKSHPNSLEAVGDFRKEVSRRWAILEGEMERVHPPLKELSRKTAQKIDRVLAGFEKRLVESLKYLDSSATVRIRRVAGHMTPRGRLQEREFSIWYYLALFGMSFKDDLIGALDPAADAHQVVSM